MVNVQENITLWEKSLNLIFYFMGKSPNLVSYFNGQIWDVRGSITCTIKRLFVKMFHSITFTNRETRNVFAHQSNIIISFRTLNRVCNIYFKLDGPGGNLFLYAGSNAEDGGCERWRLSKDLPALFISEYELIKLWPFSHKIPTGFLVG